MATATETMLPAAPAVPPAAQAEAPVSGPKPSLGLQPPPALSPAQQFRELWQWLKPYRPRLTLVMLALVVELAFSTAFPLSLKFIIDRAIGQHDASLLVGLIAILGVLFLFASAAGIGRKYLTSDIGAEVMNDMRH
ncbi:MAG TPA: hypothetical protein VFS62_09455, partial [Chloroflexota bacterium]|nr:hypothetical protein [Chloroflexota bacterium]